MIRINEVALSLDYDETSLKKAAAKKLNISVGDIKYISLYKRSVDARKKDNVHFTAAVDVKVDNENKVLKKCKSAVLVEEYKYDLPKCRKLSKRPVIIGSGPCGMFAALILAQCGQNPIIIERGRDVDSRTKDVNTFWSGGVLDEKSNVQFGEGGAGTFSDGKLNTGTKDKRIRKVLEEFAANGSPKEILYLAKFMAYTVLPLLKAGVSDVLRYFGCISDMILPPNPTTFPRKSIMGNMTLSENLS